MIAAVAREIRRRFAAGAEDEAVGGVLGEGPVDAGPVGLVGLAEI